MKLRHLTLAIAIAAALPAAAEELGPELYISPKGEARLTRAELVSQHSLNLFKVSIWGQKWTVQAIPVSPFTRFEAANGETLKAADLAPGHLIEVRGRILPDIIGVIEATTIRDLTLQSGTGGAASALASSVSGVSQLTKHLASGMRGPEIALLQDFLWRRNWGIPDESFVTGYFGATTFAAVKNFQAVNGLPPEGEVGPRTRALINSLLKR
ncbi:MAG: peptidoglycan-binding protein [Candidatus Sungbacteria bacterium]|uniref:Peptidoglycan-binding protein n=1 Tax=Candidatus Sungiibacteriota bacterium TaxID=2750080 RepID=A0A932YXG3_9BACT|nr:peptidoglycan-binding protein [Candidatus Sungbacteria bacterium]